ncbi:MAG TPA: erythromycin biosynthesis sensory transduction protein eryC1 [Gammaproteobacteria bacterium]|nr:erythromycin biosynthesis sensory transduction protein eryC1 [Gammaproteobacteria bacterium]
MIPMVDLKAQYTNLKPEIDQAINEVLSSGQFILGHNVEAFEKEVADYLGCQFAISCNSGTDALHLALRGLGISEGDEVITSTFTFIATAEAIAYVGAKPVFVDIEPDTFNLDPAAVESAITPATRAIIPVHLYGRPANMPTLQAISKKHQVLLIEDCAQSFGASISGQKTGTIGNAGCFSFFPSKNLGCYGDGGLITTNDQTLAEEIYTLRNHGSKKRYEHAMVGYNSRLDELQAAILRCKLKEIDRFNEARWQVAAAYNAALSSLKDVSTPALLTPHAHVFHQYTLRSQSRDQLAETLRQHQVATAIYYPIPLHRQQAFSNTQELQLPVAEQIATECLSLPIYPELPHQDIDFITHLIANAQH